MVGSCRELSGVSGKTRLRVGWLSQSNYASTEIVSCCKIPISYNFGRCQAFLSVLTRALRRARHFALAEAVPYPTKARSQSVSGQELSPTHPSLRSHARS
jgi:hypothetical protein